jgi:hypothetical protein
MPCDTNDCPVSQEGRERFCALRLTLTWTTEKHYPRGAVFRHAGETAACDPVVVRRRQRRRRSPQSDAIGSYLLSRISVRPALPYRVARLLRGLSINSGSGLLVKRRMKPVFGCSVTNRRMKSETRDHLIRNRSSERTVLDLLLLALDSCPMSCFLFVVSS